MTVLLLFGAGASYGAGGVNKTPPLGTELFSSLCKDFPLSWGKIAPDLAKGFSPDFEEGMAVLTAGLKNNLMNLLRDMAIYFSRFTVTKSSNLYVQLLETYKVEFANNKVILSTLNYGCLIESALQHVGFLPVYNGPDKGPRLLKPHGSCNFIPRGITGGVGTMTYEIQAGAIINCLKVETVNPDLVESEMANIPVPPVMSFFTKDKVDIMTPALIKAIRAEFKETALKAKKIITIGVRPNPYDVHVWGPISESKAEVFVVCDEAQFKEWSAAHRKDAKYLGYKFKGTFVDLCKVINSGINHKGSVTM